MPARPVSDEDDVVVRVDNAGNYRLPLEVNAPDITSRHGDVVTHGGEAAVLDQQLRDNPIVRVHRVDLTVHEDKVCDCACRYRGLPLCEQFRATQSPQGKRAKPAEELPAPKSLGNIFFGHVCLPD